MKRSVFILSLISLALIFSCTEEKKKGNQKTSKDLTIKVDTLTFNDTTPLYEGANVGFNMRMHIEWPEDAVSEEALKNMQRNITCLLFDKDLSTTDIEFAMKAYNRKASELYIEVNDGEYDDCSEDSYMTDWEEFIEGSFMKPYGDLISYQKYTSGYSGGAHGLDALSYITFDRKTGNVISDSELFKEGYQDRLIESLRANLLFSVEDTDMLFELDILPSDNFYLNEKGITYIYQRYEIGPYYLGIIKVTIPWKEIQDILK